MTPELYAFVSRINDLNSIEARSEIRHLDEEVLVDIVWTLCHEVQKQADTIKSVVRILTD